MKKSEALKILGLSEGFTDDELKQAHRQKVRENHPDRFTDPTKKAEAEEQTKLINEARDVLANKRWEPEYGPRTGTGYSYNPYGSPYGNPYGGYGTGSSGNNQDETYYDPFDFIWTSWTEVPGQGYGGRGAHAADPFASSYTRAPEKTPKEEFEEAKRVLQTTGSFTLCKLVVFAALFLMGNPMAGMFVYAVGTFAYAVYTGMKGCSGTAALFATVFIFFMAWRPILILMATPVSFIVLIGCLAYDISLFRKHFQLYTTAKEKLKVSAKPE